MTESIGVGISTEQASAVIRLRGLLPDRWYTVQRKEIDGVITSRGWHTIPSIRRVVPPNAVDITRVDITIPFDTSCQYRLMRSKRKDSLGTEVAASDVEQLTWITANPNNPLDPRNDLPIFRDALRADLPAFRAVIVDLEYEWAARSEVTPIIGSIAPRVSSDRRQLKAGTMSVMTTSAVQRRAFLDLFLGSRVIQCRAPVIGEDPLGMSDLYFVAKDLTEVVFDKNSPAVRQWDVDFQQVPAPAEFTAPKWSNSTTYDESKDVFATYAAAAAALEDYDQANTDITPDSRILPDSEVVYLGSL